MVEFGVCELNGLMKVDYLEKSTLGLDSTIIHELIHSKLMESTSYGQALNLFGMISGIDKKYEYPLEVLKKNMMKVQEIIANSIEYLLYLKKEGKDKFENKVKILKIENEQYYKYLMEFKYLIYNENINIDKKITIIFHIGRECLNIDITQIDKKWLNGKKLTKFLNHQDNSIKFLPNSRFKKISKDLKKYLENNKEVNFNEIEKIIYSLPSSDKANGQVAEEIIKYIEIITEDSDRKILIKKLLDRLCVVNASLNDPLNIQLYPLNKRYDEKVISYKEFCDIKSKIPTVIFCSLAMDEEINRMKDNKIPYLSYSRCVYTNVEFKTDYIIKDLNFVDILNDRKNIKVIDFSSYINLEFSTMSLLKEQQLYVLSNISYIALKQSFKHILENNYKFRVINFEGFNAVIVNLQENINLILLLDSTNFSQFILDVLSKECKFEEITTTNDVPFDDTILKLDDTILKSKDDFLAYINIINAYLEA